LTVAAELQWDLLPPQTFSDSRVTISGVLEPTYEVAGDSFDYALNGDTLLFMIADAMGHGFEATMLTTVAIGAYRHSRRLGLDLASTYCAMDALVAERFGPDRFLTAQLGELDMRTGVLRLLNAGHPAPLTVRERGVANLSCEPTLPIGFGGVVTEVVEERLQPGQHVLLYTDGVVEARAEDGEFFGEKRLEDLLVRAITAELPAAETVRRLAHAILEHQGGELQDDATTVLLTWHGTG
jgi:serine phosphatase RsbU (regulator of sigma subunit)